MGGEGLRVLKLAKIKKYLLSLIPQAEVLRKYWPGILKRPDLVGFQLAGLVFPLGAGLAVCLSGGVTALQSVHF